MMNLFTFDDYDEAYYNYQVGKCKEIGTYLLSTLNDTKSKEYLRRLEKIDYSWNLPQEELQVIQELLAQIRIWLMVNCTH